MSGVCAPQGDPYPGHSGAYRDNIVVTDDDVEMAKRVGAGIGDDDDASGQLQARS